MPRPNTSGPTPHTTQQSQPSYRLPCVAALGLTVLLLAPACGNSDPPAGSTSQRPTAQLPQGEYESVLDTYDIGYGPDGPVYGHEHVTFEGNEVTWDHSDVRERSTCRKTDGGFEAVFGARTVLGRYDADTDDLNWDGKPFRKTR